MTKREFVEKAAIASRSSYEIRDKVVPSVLVDEILKLWNEINARFMPGVPDSVIPKED